MSINLLQAILVGGPANKVDLPGPKRMEFGGGL